MTTTNDNFNFLPEDYLERKAQRRASILCGALFIVVMGGMGWAFWYSEQTTDRLDREMADVDNQYVAEAKRIDQVTEMQEKQKRMAHQADMTSSLLERVPRSVLLAEYTNLLPNGVSLLDIKLDSRLIVTTPTVDTTKTAFEQKQAAKQATLPGSEPRKYEVTIQVTGVAGNDGQVAAYLKKLSQSKLLKDVSLNQTEEFVVDKQPMRKFQVEMQIDPAVDVQQLAGGGKEARDAASAGTDAAPAVPEQTGGAQ